MRRIWNAALAAFIAGAVLAFLVDRAAGQTREDSLRVQAAMDSLEAILLDIYTSPVLPPTPDPGDSLPPIGDVPLVSSAIGWGEDVLKACAPEEGPWDIQVWRATESTELHPNQNPPDSTLHWVIEQDWSTSADLIVVIPTVGGLQAGTLPLNGQTRRNCIVFAGHAAPETLWIQGPAIFRDQWKDVWYRGFGHIADNTGSGIFNSNMVSLWCVEDVLVEELSIAFAANDQLSFSTGCSRESTITRTINGPTAGGTSGRGGGIFGGDTPEECGHLSYGIILAFENMRRNPIIGCGTVDPQEVGLFVTYNATDATRIARTDTKVNIRSIVSIAGPVTGCARDRVLTWFDQADVEPRSEVYLEEIIGFARPGCDWTEITTLWGGEHTVFHYSGAGHPAPFDLHGTGVPHSGPERGFPVISAREVEDYVLSRVGANFRLGCDGAVVHRMNDLSRRIIERVVARQFASSPWETLHQFENETGGPLEFPNGVPCADGDQDGLPDEFEALHGGSLDPGNLAPSGLPWILEYLNGTQ